MTDSTAVSVHHEGAELVGMLAMPEAPGPHPGVLVMHSALGISDSMRERAVTLARLGYAGLAVDMFGGGRNDAVTAQKAGPFDELIAAPELLRARTVAWHQALVGTPGVDPARTAAIGYCFGGQCVLELARSGADLRVAVSFHGPLTTAAPAEPGRVRAHIAVYTGGKDPYVPREHVEALAQELKKAAVQHTLTVFSEAVHSFTDPNAASIRLPGIAYDPIADAVSWAGTVALLAELTAS
ncbi:dienelactone hydrolase family protein [Nocardia beijingensis]|uniref:dienelactone hydrolase family protein n=1 Tax=Nocardia beijingensis TaxID=95162 RepID=UPI00344B2DA6